MHTAILTLKEGLEGQITGHNIEIGIVGEDRKFRRVARGRDVPVLLCLRL